MPVVFDYIYYRLCLFFRRNDKKHPNYPLTAYFVISLFQIVNFISVVVLISIVVRRLLLIEWVSGIAIVIIVLGINFYRYDKKHPFEELEKKWQGEPKAKKTRGALLVVSYFVYTVLFLVFCTKWLNHFPRGKGEFPVIYR